MGPILEIIGNDRRDPSRFLGETFQTGRVCARILAAGYETFVMTPDPARSPLMAPMRITNMVVRMRKGGDLHGQVVDYRGSPVPGCQVYLVESNMSLRFGKPTDWHNATPSMTDAGGRFTLTGGKAPAPRIIAMSEDGRLFTLVSNVDAGHRSL